MTEARLTPEVAQDLELNYAPWGADKTITNPETNDVWEFVAENDQGYDEGTVTTQLIWRHLETGELWAVVYDSNSWGDYYEVVECYRAEPAQKTITVYNRA